MSPILVPLTSRCDSHFERSKISFSEGYFPLGGIFRAERHFLLFKDQLAESGRQKTKENIIPRGKFRLVENDPKNKLNGVDLNSDRRDCCVWK